MTVDPLTLIAAVLVAYNIGAGDVRAAVTCAGLWLVVQAAWRLGKPRTPSERAWRHDPEMVDLRVIRPFDQTRD